MPVGIYTWFSGGIDDGEVGKKYGRVGKKTVPNLAGCGHDRRLRAWLGRRLAASVYAR